MKFKNIFSITAIMAMLSVVVACGGGSDDPEPTPTPPSVTPPTVLSTTPANGATDIATGAVSIQVSYDKDINMSNDASLKPVISGGTLSGSASVSGKNLSFTINCPDYETLVTVKIPRGLIGVTGALAAEYSFSFTTKKKPEAVNNEATALAKKLGWGWNLGNHFDTSSGQDGVHPQWGYWDKATPTQTLYTNLKAAHQILGLSRLATLLR